MLALFRLKSLAVFAQPNTPVQRPQPFALLAGPSLRLARKQGYFFLVNCVSTVHLAYAAWFEEWPCQLDTKSKLLIKAWYLSA